MSQIIEEIRLAREIGVELGTFRRAVLEAMPKSVHGQLLKYEVAIMTSANREAMISGFRAWVAYASSHCSVSVPSKQREQRPTASRPDVSSSES